MHVLCRLALFLDCNNLDKGIGQGWWYFRGTEIHGVSRNTTEMKDCENHRKKSRENAEHHGNTGMGLVIGVRKHRPF